MIEITLRVDAKTLSAIAALLNNEEAPAIKASPVVEPKPKAKPEPKPKAKPEPKPKAKPEPKPKAKPEPKPKAKPEPKPELDYDKDLKPWLVKLASHANDGREAALEIVKSYGVRSAKNIPADKFSEAIETVKVKLAELDEAEEVAFE